MAAGDTTVGIGPSCAGSRPSSRSWPRSTGWPRTASRARLGDPAPSGPRARGPQENRGVCALSWLHPLKSWSLRETRCGSGSSLPRDHDIRSAAACAHGLDFGEDRPGEGSRRHRGQDRGHAENLRGFGDTDGVVEDERPVMALHTNLGLVVDQEQDPVLRGQQFMRALWCGGRGGPHGLLGPLRSPCAAVRAGHGYCASALSEAVCCFATAASIRRSGTSHMSATATNAAMPVHGAMDHAAAVPSAYSTNEILPLRFLPSARANGLSSPWCEMSWFC